MPRRTSNAWSWSSRTVRTTRSTVTRNIITTLTKMCYRQGDDTGGGVDGRHDTAGVPAPPAFHAHPVDPAHERRQGPARGRRAVLLVPAADRRAVRGPGRRPRAAAAVPRPDRRLRRRHRAGDRDVPDRRPRDRRGPPGLL